jgi:CcmD family protein
MKRWAIGVGLLVVLIGALAASRAGAEGSPGALAPGATALAQLDQPAPAGDRPLDLERQKTRSRFHYLMLGYGLIWLSLGVYLIQMNRRVASVGREIDELKGRLDDLQGGGRRGGS